MIEHTQFYHQFSAVDFFGMTALALFMFWLLAPHRVPQKLYVEMLEFVMANLAFEETAPNAQYLLDKVFNRYFVPPLREARRMLLLAAAFIGACGLDHSVHGSLQLFAEFEAWVSTITLAFCFLRVFQLFGWWLDWRWPVALNQKAALLWHKITGSCDGV